jgi:long-chain acyl-CoA synthetase
VRVAIDPVVIDKRPRSLVHMFLERVECSPDADAYYYPVEGGWQESTWAHTHELVEGLAGGLLALGIEPEDRVAIVTSSRFEWVLAHLATLWAGGAVTAVDPDAGDDAITHLLADSRARVVIAEDYDTVHTLWRIRARIRDVIKVVQVDGDFPDERVLTLEGLLTLGHEHLRQHPRALSQRLYAVRRQGLAALPYVTDPTRGRRGVRLTHAALTYQATAIAMLGELGETDLVYVALPLRSTYARAVLGAQLAVGFPIALEGTPEDRGRALPMVRPTVVTGTPAMLRQLRGEIEERQGSGFLRRQRSLEKKVHSDVHEAFGDRLRFVVSAGTGLDTDLADFFASAGVTVLEAYGRARTGAVSVALPSDVGSRTAGRPLPGTEVRISEDGEIQVASPGLMAGYHGQRSRSTAASSGGPDDRWLSTGDAGVLDDQGRLRVLGRRV